MSLAARLNKRITIQLQGTEQDATGQVIDEWKNVITEGDGNCWAEIKDISGREFIAGTAEQSSITTRITIRHRPDISNLMRVLHGVELYEVIAVLGQDGRTLQLMCTRGRL